MRVYAKIKKAGSRRSVLVKEPYEMPCGIGTLGDVITFFVGEEVKRYESRGEGEMLGILSERDLQDAANAGKISFGYGEGEKRKADPVKAVEAALLCFEDGLVRVFINDRELKSLEDEVDVRDEDIFTFIRLSFLSGRRW